MFFDVETETSVDSVVLDSITSLNSSSSSSLLSTFSLWTVLLLTELSTSSTELSSSGLSSGLGSVVARSELNINVKIHLVMLSLTDLTETGRDWRLVQ